MGTLVVVLGVLLAISLGWHPWNDGWTDGRIDDFMIRCTDPAQGGADTRTCQCLAREFQERMTYDEFRSANTRINEGGEAPAEVLAARANCNL